MFESIVEFQGRVNDWMQNCFGPAIAADQQERNYRFIEEAIELVQACNLPKERLLQIVEHVYTRAAGQPAEEIGDVMISLAALSSAAKVNMEQSAVTGVAKCVKNTELIRKKRKEKPEFLRGTS